MTLRLVVALLILICTVLTAALATAEIQTITATHTYAMGDNDSKNDARHLCFLEAKRKVLEKAGTFIESSSEIKNFQLSKDQITSYTAAVLSVDTAKEEFGSNNGQNTVTMTVRADVDIVDVQKRLASIVADKGLQEKISAQQQQLKQLEGQMQALNVKLGTTPTNSSTELRKERNVVFGNIQELESKKLAAVQRITAKTGLVKKYIVKNMTAEEVISILGQPQQIQDGDKHYRRYFYGERWICFSYGLVNGVGKDITCDPNELK